MSKVYNPTSVFPCVSVAAAFVLQPSLQHISPLVSPFPGLPSLFHQSRGVGLPWHWSHGSPLLFFLVPSAFST